MAQLAEWGDSKLRWGRFSPVYRSRLLDGGQMLGQFLHAHGMKWERIKEGRSNSVDETLDSFVRFMHGLGRRSSLMKAKHAVLFVQTVRPRLHGLLKSTWNTLRSWEEMSPAGFRSPMPLPLLAALLCQSRIIAVRTEDSVEKKLWFIFAGLVAVSFFGMLRPGELFWVASWRCLLAAFHGTCSIICSDPIEEAKECPSDGAATILRSASP